MNENSGKYVKGLTGIFINETYNQINVQYL